MIRIITVPCPGCRGRFMVLHPKHMFLEGYLKFDIIYNIYFAYDMVRTQTGAPSGWLGLGLRG